MKTRCLAMILAGGQGSRLGVLTANVAKPAVPFGGKYRIIDFPLSNCAHSGVERVGVLTQYKSFALNNYVSGEDAWDLQRRDGGVFVLPPYARENDEADWYKGTADAIYQNLQFIETSNPDYVLVLSGDHIYAMDYSLMMDAHEANQADTTIAVFTVPWEEAPRFGIMNTDESKRIVEFEEKPKQPKSNLASMGVYLFSTEFLYKYLKDDAKDDSSSHDFGKDVIPKMLRDGGRLFAYNFDGYWKDVGTIESLWQANMDFLTETPPIDIGGPWRICSANLPMPPHFVGAGAKVAHSLINEGSVVCGDVDRTVVSTGVRIAKGAKVSNSVLLPFARIEEGATVDYAIVGQHSTISAGASLIGTENKIAVTGDSVVVRA